MRLQQKCRRVNQYQFPAIENLLIVLEKCRCLKNKVKCSVHCHATDCHNLSELAIRTEVALVDRRIEEDEQFPEEEQLQEEKQPQKEGPQEEEQSQEEEELREEEQPQEQDCGLSGIQDSNHLPPPSRKRTRQTTQPQHRNVRREAEF